MVCLHFFLCPTIFTSKLYFFTDHLPTQVPSAARLNYVPPI